MTVLDPDPHRATLDRYEAGAGAWEAGRGRSPSATGDDAGRFAASLPPAPGPVVDLGCGPGRHLGELPDGTIALDAAAAMLERVPAHAPGAPRVRADLRALPFADRSLGAAWANRSYVHLARPLLPLALWDLHRALRVGGTAYLSLLAGDADHTELPDAVLPGRWFSLWPGDLLTAVLEGAGFAVRTLEARPTPGGELLAVTVQRLHTLADTVGPGMRLLLVGLNPSEYAAEVGVGFARPGNRAWPALLAAGLTDRDRDPHHLLVAHRVGMTDLVKRATPRASALTREEYRHGVARLDRLCRWLRPGAVCVVGLSGWRAAVDPRARAGVQAATLGDRPVYLMPNPSGVNGHVRTEDLAEHLRAAAALADRTPTPVPAPVPEPDPGAAP